MPINLTSRSMRRARWSARAPQIALMATCAALSAAGLRAATHTSNASVARVDAPVRQADNTEAEAVAQAFTRAYLTWDAAHPQARVAALRQFSSPLADHASSATDAGPQGRQRVTWTAVSADEVAANGARRVTVLADTTGGPTALTVTVTAHRGGSFRIDGAPALVGLPHPAPATDDSSPDPVDDPGLSSTVTRALSNYLAGRRDALAADLLPGAVVVTPAAGVRLASVDETTWTNPGRQVRVAVSVRLPGGGDMALAYELGVVRQAGRWFVRWIENQSTGGSR